ncbi:hypothetical protein [Vibrio coralliilyticus]|uniref:hypothetical protein n=1 Tax=Vibrio coralliilyticus TaxID=190893 RepID=UPI00185A105D|nr:hypothetical protein [Vibrio coralliilyticus]NUW69912.1 hypothetical protein [Vibrio coralliilyticus]
MNKQRMRSATLMQCGVRDAWLGQSGAGTTEERKYVIKVWNYFVNKGLMTDSGYLEVPQGSYYGWQSVEAYYKELINEPV